MSPDVDVSWPFEKLLSRLKGYPGERVHINMVLAVKMLEEAMSGLRVFGADLGSQAKQNRVIMKSASETIKDSIATLKQGVDEASAVSSQSATMLVRWTRALVFVGVMNAIAIVAAAWLTR